MLPPPNPPPLLTHPLHPPQIVQYINLVKPDSGSGSYEYGTEFMTADGGVFPWLSADEFEGDDAAGHGTHTAGSAAGATVDVPAETVTCSGTDVMGCVGGCVPESSSSFDDLVSSYAQFFLHTDIDRICPSLGCDDAAWCLSDDVPETLTSNGGMAQGAKLAIFDIFHMEGGYAFSAGTGLWEASEGTGAMVHSSSWGGDTLCQVTPFDTLYDDYMYNVRLLLLLLLLVLPKTMWLA